MHLAISFVVGIFPFRVALFDEKYIIAKTIGILIHYREFYVSEGELNPTMMYVLESNAPNVTFMLDFRLGH